MKQKKRSCIYTKFSVFICVCALIFNCLSFLNVEAVGAERAICSHANPQKETERVTEYTHTAYKNCYSTIQYTYYKCNDCGATWTDVQNVETGTHDWRETSHSTKKSYSYNVSGNCYTSTDTITSQCYRCRITKTETKNGSTVPHSWHEVLDYYDGTYSHLKTECRNCSIVAAHRQVKGYVEVGLNRIKKESKQGGFQNED